MPSGDIYALDVFFPRLIGDPQKSDLQGKKVSFARCSQNELCTSEQKRIISNQAIAKIQVNAIPVMMVGNVRPTERHTR